jgi:hypothetical protein
VRLAVLDSGHGFKAKALFAFIRAVSRRPPPDVIKLLKYRPEYFGAPMSAHFHEVMRGPGQWSVAERELIAAFVSKVNECEF